MPAPAAPPPPAPATPDWMSSPTEPAFGAAPSGTAPGLGTASLPRYEEPAWGKPAEPAWGAPAEPSWGSFELEPEPASPPVAAPPPPPAAPEPFDREPSFSLEPDPGYQVQAEPVFSMEEGEPSFAVRDDVFGAPAELSFDESPPQDRYIPDEPAAIYVETPAVPAWQTPPVEPEPAYPPAAYEPAPAHAGHADPHAGNGNGRLSDEDVDRVARRVVELLGDRAVRDVAWEVIPDLAEVIIRDRLRELESQVE
jgi:hypothetical protein